MGLPSLNHLPNELLVHILGYLDSGPASQRCFNRTPGHDMFLDPRAPVKALSRTCKQWRRLTFTTLFKSLRIDVANMLYSERNKLYNDPAHVMELVEEWCAGVSERISFGPDTTLLVQCRIMHISDAVHEDEVPQGLDPNVELLRDTICKLWKSILQVINPARLVIHGRYNELVYLIGGNSFVSRPSNEKRYFAIELSSEPSPYRHPTPDDESTSGYNVASAAKVARSSIFRMRPWLHIGFNEGSFFKPEHSQALRQFDERSLLQMIFPACCHQQATVHSHRAQYIRTQMSAVNSLSLTAPCKRAIGFPSMQPDNGVHWFQFVRHLTLSLLPKLDPHNSKFHELTTDERYHIWKCYIVDTFRQYSDLRLAIVSGLSRGKEWRLRTVICDDYDEMTKAGYEHNVKGFEVGMEQRFRAAQIPPFIGDICKWGRVWEIVPSDEDPERLCFLAHD